MLGVGWGSLGGNQMGEGQLGKGEESLRLIDLVVMVTGMPLATNRDRT